MNIYAAIEGTTLFGLVDKVLRMEFYSTSALAQAAIARWATDGWFKDQKWMRSSNDEWKCMIDDVMCVMLVEEHVVHTELQGETPVICDFPPFEPVQPYKYPTDCAHDGCSECHGTGTKDSGGPCVHFLYCTCAKCNPFYD